MKKKSWIVKLKLTSITEVITEPCTEAEAREHPYNHAVHENKKDTQDYEVLSVEPNE